MNSFVANPANQRQLNARELLAVQSKVEKAIFSLKLKDIVGSVRCYNRFGVRWTQVGNLDTLLKDNGITPQDIRNFMQAVTGQGGNAALAVAEIPHNGAPPMASVAFAILGQSITVHPGKVFQIMDGQDGFIPNESLEPIQVPANSFVKAGVRVFETNIAYPAIQVYLI